MRTTFIISSVAIIAFTVISVVSGRCHAGVFEEDYGLRPAAVVIRGGDRATYMEVRRIIESMEAKGLIHNPPDFVFGYFPQDMAASRFAGLDVTILRSGDEALVGFGDRTTRRVIASLFDQRAMIEKSPAAPKDAGPIDAGMPGIPPEDLVKFGGTAGPRIGAPSEILERGIQQNSEFLVGKVLVNVIFPESLGSGEDWTDTEIEEVLQYINVGLSQYTQVTHWADLEFFVNCPQQWRRVPVTFEPVDGYWSTDGIWIRDILEHLDALEYYTADPAAGHVGNTHLLNNATREQWGTDWVFTAYMADASNGGCWMSCRDDNPDTPCYAAYTIQLGGPFQVVPYPACGFGTGINFSHVFIHEMSHVFWALDEYASAAMPCNARSGYLNITNENSYHVPMGASGPCGYELDCIMNNYELTEPLPICPWTMGQVGLGDYNENNIPDVYDLPPVVDMIYVPGISSDTTYDGSYIMGAVTWNAAVENRNPMQDPAVRVDYAPWIKRGWMQINRGVLQAISPGDGVWDESREDLSFFLEEGLEPGDNTIRFIVENCVGLQARDSIDVTYIGMKFYQVDTEAGSEYINLSWITASQVFGAQFEVWREDYTAGTGFELIDTVDGDHPASGGYSRNYYLYRDDDVKAMHQYNYRIVSRITAVVQGEEKEFLTESGVFSEKSLIPVVSGIMSPVAPNPFDLTSTDRAEWTIRLPGDLQDLSSTGARPVQGASAATGKIMLEVDIYNINGQMVRRLYALPVFGGRYKDMVWDGTNDRGQRVANGIYFIRVRAGSEEQVRKVVVLR